MKKQTKIYLVLGIIAVAVIALAVYYIRKRPDAEGSNAGKNTGSGTSTNNSSAKAAEGSNTGKAPIWQNTGRATTWQNTGKVSSTATNAGKYV